MSKIRDTTICVVGIGCDHSTIDLVIEEVNILLYDINKKIEYEKLPVNNNAHDPIYNPCEALGKLTLMDL